MSTSSPNNNEEVIVLSSSVPQFNILDNKLDLILSILMDRPDSPTMASSSRKAMLQKKRRISISSDSDTDITKTDANSIKNTNNN